MQIWCIALMHRVYRPDTLVGCLAERGAGAAELDVLTGGAGKDIFVLGVTDGVLYNDGMAAKSGLGDYALITDFTRVLTVCSCLGKKQRLPQCERSQGRRWDRYLL